MSALLRNSGMLLLVLGLAACQPPEPPVLAPAAKATTQPAQQPAANDDLDPMARTPIVDPPSAEGTSNGDAPAVASVALDHAGDVLVGQHMSDVKHLGSWESQGAIETCEYFTGKGLPPGVSMMVDDGRIVRFDLDQDEDEDAETPVAQPGPYGLRIGMTRAQALAQFPGAPVPSRMPIWTTRGNTSPGRTRVPTWASAWNCLKGRLPRCTGEPVKRLN